MQFEPETGTRRGFLKTTAFALAAAPLLGPEADGASINQADAVVPEEIGPVLGHVDERTLCCFIRPRQGGPVTLALADASGTEIKRLTVDARLENDGCAHFIVDGLSPGTIYQGRFSGEDGSSLFAGAEFTVKTPETAAAADRAVLGMASCISSTSFDEVWQQVEKQRVEAFCLLGDSPYIDSNDLAANRRARRLFWGHLPTLRKLARSIPFWNTWDDHDFGKNDSDGLMPKKEDIRRAFVEYNALLTCGQDGQGIHTRFRRGPIEVWLIDDRWFSQTASSWADPSQKTCIGMEQWQWLQRTLKESTAPFKILCTGMVWYPKGNREKDHWETYSSEREAIFAFIQKERIPGVVLVSGDIHVSRHHDYGRERLGYPLHECVVSPMHQSVIPSLDVPHPARVWSKPEPIVFLVLDATRERLDLRWINASGTVIHSFQLKATELGA